MRPIERNISPFSVVFLQMHSCVPLVQKFHVVQLDVVLPENVVVHIFFNKTHAVGLEEMVNKH